MAHITDDPPEVVEMTLEEFEAKKAEYAASLFPDLAPCCRKERRNYNGWCISCGDPCY